MAVDLWLRCSRSWWLMLRWPSLMRCMSGSGVGLRGRSRGLGCVGMCPGWLRGWSARTAGRWPSGLVNALRTGCRAASHRAREGDNVETERKFVVARSGHRGVEVGEAVHRLHNGAVGHRDHWRAVEDPARVDIGVEPPLGVRVVPIDREALGRREQPSTGCNAPVRAVAAAAYSDPAGSDQRRPDDEWWPPIDLRRPLV